MTALRVAAIDCGTNTMRLLIGEGVPGSDTFAELHRESRTVRLGEGVDATGELTTAALDRAWAALVDYAAVIRSSGVVDVRVAATSALRDTRNPQDFIDLVRSVLGTGVDILSGDEEAKIGFRGTVFPLQPGAGAVLSIDIGGGSTEIVLGRRPGRTANGAVVAGRPLHAVSIDVGAVRVTERMLRADPPSTTDIETARRWSTAVIRAALMQWPAAELRQVDAVIAVAGTAMTVAAAALHHPRLDPALLDGRRIPYPQIQRSAEMLLRAHRAHRAMLGYVLPGRVDVIGAGALILGCLLQELENRCPVSDLTISVRDILDGLVLSVLDRMH